MTDIYDLKQLSNDTWQAKYHGNYGNYIIKLTLDEKFKVKKYSCSCPSDYSPCKHIGFVRDEIKESILKINKKCKNNQITVSDVLQNVSLDELRNFIVDKAKFDTNLSNEIMLKFVGKTKNNSNVNIYSQIIADMLNAIDCDNDDYDEYGEVDIDLSFFENWLKKAKDAITISDFKAAESICKACIEEYVLWSNDLDYEIDSYVYEDYQESFFDILEEMASNNQIDKKSLYNYCKAELNKQHYANTSAKDYFNNLMAVFAIDINPEDFILSQLNQIKNISNKSSNEAKTLFNRLIDFYIANNQHYKAESVIEENLQIDDFRKKVIEKRIANKQYKEAKSIIQERLKSSIGWGSNLWKEYLLIIAQKENEVPTIRKISYEFIENSFNEKNFKIYKSTFSKEEWQTVFEKLYTTYITPSNQWNNGFKSNAAELLIAENIKERLLEYIEDKGSIENVEHYYKNFSSTFPERTLLLFQNTLNKYLENNLGRNHYEYANNILKMIRKIEGGSKVVSQMVHNYRVIYKNRRAMMEILNKL